MNVLQIGTYFTTNWGNVYYKLGHVLQIGARHTYVKGLNDDLFATK